MQTVLWQDCSVLSFWTLITAIIVITVITLTTELLEWKLHFIQRLRISIICWECMGSCKKSSLQFTFCKLVVFQNITLRNKKKCLILHRQTLGSRSQSKVHKVNKSLHRLKLWFRTTEQAETSCFQPYGTGLCSNPG